MFTGLTPIKTDVLQYEHKSGSLFLILSQPSHWGEIPDTAVCVNGVSLPVRAIVRDQIVTEAVKKTIANTTFGLTVPKHVNIEKPIVLKDGLSGQFVYGRADAMGILEEIEDEESSRLFTFSCPEEYKRYVKIDVFITVDGICSNIINVEGERFTVRYPHYLLQQTTMGVKKIGEYVNIEFDVLFRYLDTLMQSRK